MKMKAIMLAVLASLSTNVLAFDGNHLAEASKAYNLGLTTNELSANDIVLAGYFQGLVVGVAQVSTVVCYMPGTQSKQFAIVVAKYVEEHPEKYDEAETSIVSQALAEAFPCKK